jgi:hypothetical protein
MSDPINPYTQNLYGRELDGWYWFLLEEGFKNDAERCCASGHEPAGLIADRLVESADDVPAQVMEEFQALWNDVGDYPDGQSPASLTYDGMISEIARGDYAPDSATVFVLEFIRRLTRTRAS